jgi:hypothetical protein
MALYFYVSWVGLQRLSTNISIDKMALPDSYLQDFQHSFETALRNMQPISVFVLKPGDLRRPEQLQRMKDLVHDFEHSVNAYGSETTFFWLPQYEDFLRFYSGFSEADDDGGGGGEGSAEHRQPAFTYTEARLQHRFIQPKQTQTKATEQVTGGTGSPSSGGWNPSRRRRRCILTP